MRKLIAEFIGTMWLVLAGCGSAVLAGEKIGLIGVALAFGFVVISMIYALGHISGCHLNPAVSFGLWAGGRFKAKDLLSYIIAQTFGAILGACILWLIVSGKTGFSNVGDFSATGYFDGQDGYGQYSMITVFITEFLMTFMFLIIIMGTTHPKAPSSVAGLVIGLGLISLILMGGLVTNTSLNPVRSLSQAIFANNSWALPQLWLFFVAPVLGGISGGFVYKQLAPID